MTSDELKTRIQKAVERLINAYYGDNTLIDTFTNSTLKVVLERNIDKIDEFLTMFEDEDGNIDAQALIDKYVDQMNENGVPFDLRNFIKSNTIKSILPNKSLIIKRSDIMKILE